MHIFSAVHLRRCWYIWCLCSSNRSYLQVFIYWLCELSLDPAIRHAFNVSLSHSAFGFDSSNASLLHWHPHIVGYMSTTLWLYAWLHCLTITSYLLLVDKTCLQTASRAVLWSLARCAPSSAWSGSENRLFMVAPLSGWSRTSPL